MTTETADQASEQSVMDRLASKMDNLIGNQAEEQLPNTEETTQASPDVFDLEWNGKKFQVPGELKDAFMKNQDYTQKTQQIADERRRLDHVRELAEQASSEQAFAQAVAGEHQELAVIEAYLSQASKVHWAQMSTDQMLRHKVEIDSVKERREALRHAISEKRQKFDTDLKAKISELRVKAREMASKSITGFSEETEKSVRAYAVTEGLSDREIDNVLLDPRSFRVLWKAMQFDKVQAGTGKAVAAAERVVKPGAVTERMPAQTAAKLNLRKEIKSAKTSGDKARSIESFLASRFGG